MVRFTLALSLLFFTTGTYSQTNDWAPVGATWWYDQIEYSGPETTYLRVTSVMDTVILGKNCRKLRVENVGLTDTVLRNLIYTYEESGKVYHINNQGSQFRLWFDFSASLGDTITIYPEAPAEDSIVLRIDSIKPITIGGTIRNRYFHHTVNVASHLFGSPWIDGIGSEYLFTPQFATQDPPLGGPIRCYQDTALGLVQIGSNACDYIYTSIREKGTPESFPVHILNHQIHYNFSSPTDLQVYDVLGRMVLEKTGLLGRNNLSLPDHISGYVVVRCDDGEEARSTAFVIR